MKYLNAELVFPRLIDWAKLRVSARTYREMKNVDLEVYNFIEQVTSVQKAHKLFIDFYVEKVREYESNKRRNISLLETNVDYLGDTEHSNTDKRR